MSRARPPSLHAQIWVYGNSFESQLVAVVVPKQAFLDKHPDLASDEAKKAMLAVSAPPAQLHGAVACPSCCACLSKHAPARFSVPVSVAAPELCFPAWHAGDGVSANATCLAQPPPLVFWARRSWPRRARRSG
jgi:hypothetical protein